jgi:hypothetical protein
MTKELLEKKLRKKDAETIRTNVSAELDRLVKIHGFPAIRAACNRYLKLAQERAKARKQIAQLERELEALRGIV